jgi:hypothetical protein
MIRRKMPGFDGRPTLPYHVEPGPPEFNRKFQVTTANTAFAGKLLDASMITWLMSADLVSAFMFKLYGRNLLLVWTDLLPESRLGPYSTPPIASPTTFPARSGPSMGRTSNPRPAGR